MQIKDIKLVILESPFAGDIERNLRYARLAAHDCVTRGESPQASHLLFPQFLDDRDSDERALGIAMGLAWRRVADYSVFYTDYGWSKGMLAAAVSAHAEKRGIRIRALHSPPRLPPKSLGETFRPYLDSVEPILAREK